MKLIKNIGLLIALMITIIGSNYAQEKKLHSVKIEYEYFLTESIDFVDCNSFKTAFNNTIRTKTFIDSLHLKRFRYLKRLFVKKKKALNVRGIITFDFGEIKVQYCFDRYGYFEKDGMTFYNKKLLAFLEKELPLWG